MTKKLDLDRKRASPDDPSSFDGYFAEAKRGPANILEAIDPKPRPPHGITEDDPRAVAVGEAYTRIAKAVLPEAPKEAGG
ncbi:hypothetical protein [Hyphomicrobium sp.]|uniref:hypothetical protein n=1 Tax=Hyphomicrobium sp. TaxID=82 RepID=UPI001D510DA7|nr:hypothetical protein [Hyphomicrobium sp.]MBY0561534.1 hypothetical protein [Hyphomicrobium sp.]